MTFSKSIVDIIKKKQHRKPTLRQTAKKLKLEYAHKRESCQPTTFRANQLSSQSPSPQESCQSDHVSSTSDSVVTGRRVAKETRSRNPKIKNFRISSPHVHLREAHKKFRLNPTSNEWVTSTSDSDVTWRRVANETRSRNPKKKNYFKPSRSY